MRPQFLIPFPVLAMIMGLAYIYGDPARTSSTSFAAARSIAPLSEWGLLFVAGAILITLAIVTRNVTLLSWALFAGGIIYSWWAGLFAAAAFTDDRSSLTAWAIHGTIAFWHFVTAWRVKVPA